MASIDWPPVVSVAADRFPGRKGEPAPRSPGLRLGRRHPRIVGGAIIAYAARMIVDQDAATASAQQTGWEHFHHEADIGVRGFGRSMAEAFEQAAAAMTAVVVEPQVVAGRDAVNLAVTAPDPELLLYEWLNAVIYEMATRGMLFGRFRVDIDEGELRGTAWGEPIDVGRHQPTVEIKGATFTELAVRQLDDGLWLAQCVVDV